jgi:hypothetical protein
MNRTTKSGVVVSVVAAASALGLAGMGALTSNAAQAAVTGPAIKVTGPAINLNGPALSTTTVSIPSQHTLDRHEPVHQER